MKHHFAALLLVFAVCGGGLAAAKEPCTRTWAKGEYKTFREVQGELQGRLGGGKILGLSLCGGANNRYFQVMILEPSGKVLVLTIAAR
ncbi:MAG: hypothetical protein WAN43_00200 [Rhodomicrobium sp.]|jgi:hypothetical protein